MLTLDSSGVIALLVETDPDHQAAVAALSHDPGPWVVPAGILAEAAFMIQRRGGPAALEVFLEDLETGAYMLDCGERDLPRIRELVRRYRDLPLGFADASVVACAERSGGAVLTFDRRDFQVVAGEGTITLAA
ncbi:MAG: PIN domain-containing protein [Actinomycetota bacterium]|nr:PIN domain-containing protein [Actinomycetota bacterium]